MIICNSNSLTDPDLFADNSDVTVKCYRDHEDPTEEGCWVFKGAPYEAYLIEDLVSIPIGFHKSFLLRIDEIDDLKSSSLF